MLSIVRSQGLVRLAIIGSLALTAGLYPTSSRGQETLSSAGQEALRLLEADDLSAALVALEGNAATVIDRALLGTLYMELGRPRDALNVLQPIADAETADAAVLYNAGRAALALGEQEVGELYLERSVELVPDSPASRRLGLLRGAQGDLFEAYRLLKPWVHEHPADQEARLAAAAAALQLERPADAAPLLDGLTAMEKRVQLLRGQLLQQQGDLKAAVAIFESLLEDHPPFMTLDLVRLTAEAYVSVGRSADATVLLTPYAGQDPDIDLALSDTRYRTGDTEGAIATLDPWIERSDLGAETSKDIMLAYGRMQVAAGRPEIALPILQRVVEERPASTLAWKALGEALVAVGEREQAREALLKFRDLSKRDSEGRRREQAVRADPVIKALRDAERAFGSEQPGEALKILRDEIALSPEDHRLRTFEVRILISQGELKRAWVASEAAYVLLPNQAPIVYQHGSLRLARGEIDGGIRELQKALELSPDNAVIMHDLAFALAARGEQAEAESLLQRAIELNPNDRRAQATLERIRSGNLHSP